MRKFFYRYTFKEIWTPLRYLGIRLFRDQNGGRWIKVWFFRHQRFGERPIRSYKLSEIREYMNIR